MSLRIAILLSGRHGRGSNMQAIAQACAEGRIDGQVVSVIGNQADSPALALARAMGLSAKAVPSQPDEAAYAARTQTSSAWLASCGRYRARLLTRMPGAS